MNIVERFIDFTGWPSSRKTVLLGCLSAAATLLAALLVELGFGAAQTSILQTEFIARFLVMWTAVQAVIVLLSIPAARAGRDARWTAYFFALVNAPLIVGVMYLFGTMSTSLVAVFPAMVIMWAIYFDARIAWFGVGCFMVCFTITGILEATGALPYAPILLDRTIDAHRDVAWFTTFLAANLLIFGFAFSLCLLVLAARGQQENLLRKVHNELGMAAKHLEQSNKLIRRYVPSQLAEQITTGDYVAAAKPMRRKLTIFFSEVGGFTNASDELDPEELSTALNEYLSGMMAIAEQYGATINPLVGDELMIFFGAPNATNDKDHALRAVHMAQDMQKHMRALRQIWDKRGIQQPFHIRMGINTGYASVGDFGSEGRKLYSGIGVQTNLAQQIQRHCEPGRILLSPSTWALVQDEIRCTPKGEIKVNGVHYPVQVYEVATVT